MRRMHVLISYNLPDEFILLLHSSFLGIVEAERETFDG